MSPLAEVLVILAGLAASILLLGAGLKSGKGLFFSVFLFRPLLDMMRLLPLKPGMVHGLIEGAGVVVPAVLLLVLFLEKKAWLPENILPLAFAATFVVVGLIHELTMTSVEQIVRVLAPVALLLFPGVVIRSERDLKTFLRLVAVTAVLVLIAVYIDRQRTNIHPIYGWVQDRVVLRNGAMRNRMAAVFGVPTMTAFWLFQFFAVTYFLFETDKAPLRYAWAGVSLGVLGFIYLTYSRAAWLSCLLLVVLYNLFKGRLRKIAVWLAGFVVLTVAVFPSVLIRLQNLLSVGFRLKIWLGYLKSWAAGGPGTWLAGFGYARLPQKNLFSGDLIQFGATGMVENSFVFLLAGAGLLVLIAFGLMAADLGRRAYRLSRDARGSLAGDYGAWVLGLLGAWFVQSMSADLVTYVVINWYTYPFLGCLYALARLRKERSRTEATCPEPATC